MRFTDQVRKLINASGMSRYAICKRLGFSEGNFSRFMAGSAGISSDSLDRLAQMLGLIVVTSSETPETKTPALRQKLRLKRGERLRTPANKTGTITLK